MAINTHELSKNEKDILLIISLLYQGYNEEKHEIKYTEAEEDKIFTPQVVAGHYKYWYNGKEWQEDLGLDINAMNFRNYDPAIGRFVSMDPFAPAMPSWTPYKFAFNNPIVFSDPLGLYEIINGGYRLTDPDEIKSFMGYLNNEGKDKSIDDHLDYIVDHFLLEEKLDEVVIDIDSKSGKSKKSSFDKAVKNIENQVNSQVEQRSREIIDHWEIADKGINSENYWEKNIIDQEINFANGFISSVTGGITHYYKNTSITKVVKGATIVGVGGAIFGSYISYKQWSEGKISDAEFAMDIGMSIVSTASAIFSGMSGLWVVPTIYYIAKTAYEISKDKE